MCQKYIANICLFYGLLFIFLPPAEAKSNRYYWQQEVKYNMDVRMDVENNQFTGIQTIKYKNNSPDALNKVFFHLFLNAFQPGSAMDIRAQANPKAGIGLGGRISRLLPHEIGYQHIISLTMDGKPVDFQVVGTILEVSLPKTIKSGQSVKFGMEYKAQVPAFVRRSGRDNNEGIQYSMAQWYPKLCEYDVQGWHADPYIIREFYGVWGDFDVRITIDAAYTVAASGILKNAAGIGHGYSDIETNTDGELTWHFIAERVHDFVWTADTDYTHDTHVGADGLVLHSFYKPSGEFTKNWEALLPIMEEALKYINANFGQYPYPVYSFIQGGDGGMEYAMATLITGHRPITSLVGVSVHEIMHSWYQQVLGFNESYYYWMDEGFTQYAAERVMNHLRTKGLIPGEPAKVLYEGFYTGYKKVVDQDIEEPLTTHADHFETSAAYNAAAYVKGALFLNQLEYIIGKPAFDKGMLEFFNKWKFKHPVANDFIKVMESNADIELDWYKDYWIYTTKTINYSIDTVVGNRDVTIALLERDSTMPMPIDVVVELTDSSKINFTIPLDIMRGFKKEIPAQGSAYEVLPDWDWVNPYYRLEIPYGIETIKSIRIDPTNRMVDMYRADNQWPMLKE